MSAEQQPDDAPLDWGRGLKILGGTALKWGGGTMMLVTGLSWIFDNPLGWDRLDDEHNLMTFIYSALAAYVGTRMTYRRPSDIV